ncbi:MAG: helix-turn-helix transcriptional regulator [Ignavibacteriaceae bacterium]
MYLKNNLKKYRFNNSQLSQDTLAKAVGVSRQTINSIENCKFNPSVKLALKIAEYFDCKVEDLFYLER